MARRRKVWIPSLQSTTAAASTSSTLDLLVNLPGDLEAIGGLTVVRVEGILSFHCATVSTFQNCGFGITMRHEDLLSANLDMLTEAGSYIWTHFRRLTTIFVESAAGTFDPIQDLAVVSTRTMRKIRPQHQLVLACQNSTGQTVSFTFGGRVLIALP